MTSKKIENDYTVNVMKIGWGKRSYWTAFRGGNGSGLPVIEIANAYTLRALAVRVARKVTH